MNKQTLILGFVALLFVPEFGPERGSPLVSYEAYGQ